MIDRVSEKTRSYIMSRVGSKDTGPEMTVRRMLHRLGYRYRLHRGDLPGSPDLVFRQRRKVVFVHGCFWHGHDCRGGRLPESKVDYWQPKIAANRKRDAACIARLEELGWDSFVVWQCRLREPKRLRSRLVAYLGPAK
ncbi:MAG: very short patch repair endonuclease [Gammaproteobacteria bacterium]|nr:very short patch repair endonuclease [Gammaproteobacteria bacterium]